MTITEYKKNTFDLYLFNVIFIVAVCAVSIVVYISAGWKVAIFVILSSVSYLWLIPAIKIYNGTAKKSDMNGIKTFPAFGLTRRWWPAYQRMAIKLTNEEAIKECEEALEQMFDNFEHGLNRFYDWFPKIEISNENCEKRSEMLNCIFNISFRHEEIQQREKQERLAEGKAYALLLGSGIDIESSLRNKILRKTTYENCDISSKALRAKIKERNVKLLKLQKELQSSEENVNSVFKDLFS